MHSGNNGLIPEAGKLPPVAHSYGQRWIVFACIIVAVLSIAWLRFARHSQDLRPLTGSSAAFNPLLCDPSNMVSEWRADPKSASNKYVGRVLHLAGTVTKARTLDTVLEIGCGPDSPSVKIVGRFLISDFRNLALFPGARIDMVGYSYLDGNTLYLVGTELNGERAGQEQYTDSHTQY